METAVLDTTEHTLHVLDATGDTKMTWGASRPVEVEHARETFRSLRQKGYLAYSVTNKGDKGEVLREFDPGAERIIMAPQTIGG